MRDIKDASDLPRAGTAEVSEARGLRGKLGAPSLTFMVLACMSPLTGAAAYIGLLIAGGNGLGAPLTYAIVGAIMLVFAFGYVGLVKRVARPGAFYAYITASLGKRVGLGGAFLSVVTYFLVVLGLYAFGGTSLSWLVSARWGAPELTWWIYSLPFLVIAGVLSYFNVAVTVRFLMVILVVEVGIVMLYNLVIFGQGGESGISGEPFTVDALTSGSLPLAFLFVLTLFAGWESTALYYEEVRDPQRTIARATYAIVGVITVFYVMTSWALITAYGTDGAYEAIAADYSSAFGASLDQYLGSVAFDIFNVFLVTGILASALSVNNMITRYIYSLAVDGVFPRRLATVNRHGSPAAAAFLVVGVFAAALLAIVATGADANAALALSTGAGTYGFLFMFFVAAIAIFVYFLRRPEPSRLRQTMLLASAVSTGIVFAVMLVYIAQNLDLIIGDQPGLTTVLQVVVYATFLAGFLYAWWLKARRPEVFDRVGREEFVNEPQLTDHSTIIE